jgi:8-oxo-dGTP pyrophosphatase MutT (NUDIX family)
MDTNKNIDIHKAGGILIKDRKFLVERSKNKTFFIAPGGSIEEGENPKQALIRELLEEFQITVTENNLEEFGTFYAQAAGQEDKYLQMDVFIVKSWQGEPTPDNEVEEILWINSKLPEGIKVGSIFEHEVLPRLKEKNLID